MVSQTIYRYIATLLISGFATAILLIEYSLRQSIRIEEIIGIAILTTTACVLFHFWFDRRISRLDSALHEFNNGNRNARARMAGNDKIASFGNELDRMLENIVAEREALSRLERRNKAVLETATEGIISIDSEGLVESINAAAEDIFGYSKEQIVGRNVNLLMPEPYTREHDRYIRNYLETGEKKIIGIGREVSGQRSDGSIFPMELAVSEVNFGDERSFTGIVRDISKRKAAEIQLRMREEELSLTFENAPIGIVTCDLDCRILNANRASTTIVGYRRGELLGMEFNRLVDADERGRCLEFAHQAKADQLQQKLIPQTWIRKDGAKVQGILHIGVVHDEKNRPTMFVIQMEDRTEQLNAEAEARQLRERIAHVGRISILGEMMAGIAHEINQPLAAIVNYTDACQRMLESGKFSQDEMIHAMKQANAQAHRADEVIRKLRGFAKKRSLEREDVDANELIKEVVSLATLESPGLDTVITLELQEDPAKIHADPVQIQQVLLNLIRNAIDAMQESNVANQSLVIRSWSEDTATIRIEVIDRGPGIKDQDAEKIFDPFYSTKHTGMGLGLSICRSIIVSHRGQLEFENNPDAGVTFYIRLPKVSN